ncbi:hypothetical protein CCUS01_02484 [Colletotrichum cuscutae]|uniref:Uncharacterized protein n=1 Tax=Colletotrichum cuscutae TaxID=1209917 RepID=A0AAI9TZJ1_9PEZI|nr:hypothetical protein CCUS01_02484 [Colletotrichum cuscutae]
MRLYSLDWWTRSFASDEVSVSPSLYEKLERGDEYSENGSFIYDSGMNFLREFKGIYVMLDKSIHKEALKTKKLPGRHVRFDTLDAHIDLCKAHFHECLLFMPLNRYTVADLLTVWDFIRHGAGCAPGKEIRDIILYYFVATLPISRHHPSFRSTLVRGESFTHELLDKLPNVATPTDD